MALKYAPLCSRCGNRRTKSESGLCCRCRQIPNPIKLCHMCGEIKTNHESGLCNLCRKRVGSAVPVEKAIERQETILTILKMNKDHYSFGDISKRIGMPKSTVYETYQRAVRPSTREIGKNK